MKKLRPIAYEILDIKKELLNQNHSSIVRKSLEMTVDRMLIEGYIDLDMQLYLKDDGCSIKELKSIIQSCDKYIKTKEEMKIESEELVKKIEVLLKNVGLDNYYVNLDLKTNRINICKVFILKDEHLKNYFYIEGDADNCFEVLMKNKCFMQQYAALRLPRIISNFINDNPVGNGYKLEKSHSYFKTDESKYAIDLVFSINLKTVQSIEEASPILYEIYNVANNANIYFEEKVSI